MADTLDDEWWLSKEEQEKKEASDLSGLESEEEGELAVISESKKKRKHELTSEQAPASDSASGSHSEAKAQESEGTEEQPPAKKKKKRKRKKISEILANEKPKPLEASDLIQAITKHFEGKLSPIEVDQTKLKEKNFCTCNDMTHTPTSFMKTMIPKWKKIKDNMVQNPGSPVVLIVCSAAIRATELIRQLSDFRGENCKVAKLFAKHMKIEEQTKFLETSVIQIGVGTPNRLQALLEADSLHLDQVKYLVLDWSWRDVKYRRLIDIKEMRADLMNLLKKYFIPHIHRTSAKIGLF